MSNKRFNNMRMDNMSEIMQASHYIPYSLERKLPIKQKYERMHRGTLYLTKKSHLLCPKVFTNHEQALHAILRKETKKLSIGKKPTEISKKLSKALPQEASLFFNQPNARVDCLYASKLSYWTLEESVAYSFGKNPEIVNWKSLQQYVHCSSFAKAYLERRELTFRGQVCNELLINDAPASYIQWFKYKAIPFDKKLVEAISKEPSNILDVKTENKSFCNIIKTQELTIKTQKDIIQNYANQTVLLASQLKELQSMIQVLEQSQGTSKEKSLHTKERETKNKLIAAMALGGYGYNPHAKQNEAINDIEQDITKYEISLNVTSIRTHIKEAIDTSVSSEVLKNMKSNF